MQHLCVASKLDQTPANVTIIRNFLFIRALMDGIIFMNQFNNHRNLQRTQIMFPNYKNSPKL